MGFFLTVLSLILSFTSMATSERSAFHRALAAHHAPVLYQELGRNPVADIFTRIDFDGDLNSANNWKHTKSAARVGSFIYFDVIETKDHWFISYFLFYPRDYDTICFWTNCHENDLEGLRLTIEKRTDIEMGVVTQMETQAHGDILMERSPTFMEAGRGARAMVQRGGHGIYSLNERRPSKKVKVYRYTGNPHDGYDLLSFHEFWKVRSLIGEGKLWLGSFDYIGKNVILRGLPVSFAGKRWGNNGGNPPWNWNTAGLNKGDWFFDPAFSLGLDSDYVYNPYIGKGDFDPP